MVRRDSNLLAADKPVEMAQRMAKFDQVTKNTKHTTNWNFRVICIIYEISCLRNTDIVPSSWRAAQLKIMQRIDAESMVCSATAPGICERYAFAVPRYCN